MSRTDGQQDPEGFVTLMFFVCVIIILAGFLLGVW